MIWIELLLSITTLIGIRLFGQGKRMWIYTKQYGFIPVDFGLMFIYWERLYSHMKGGT